MLNDRHPLDGVFDVGDIFCVSICPTCGEPWLPTNINICSYCGKECLPIDLPLDEALKRDSLCITKIAEDAFISHQINRLLQSSS